MSVPVYLLSGFLGSGKTTLLLRLLEECARRGLSAALLMNELGRIDVDGSLVSEKLRLPVRKLLDGCVCCTKRSELESSLASLARTEPDVLFVELTGVADPAELRELLQAGGPLAAAGLELAAVVTVVDAGTFAEYNSRFSADRELVRTLRSQIASADLVLLNKADTIAEAGRLSVRRAVRKQNATAAVLETERCRIDAASLLHGVHPRSGAPGLAPAPAAAPSSVAGGAVSAAELGATSASRLIRSAGAPPAGGGSGSAPSGTLKALRTAAPASADSFSGGTLRSLTLSAPAGRQPERAEVERFLQELGGGLVRAKGYWRDGAETLLLQHAGGRTEWEQASYPGQPYLVLIGEGLDEGSLRERWASLSGSRP
ncbi:GTP-binding protein [Paenibacillus albicereus]|uniref:GTP-binding protein n=1 Tax=Paenibacillus albicereus TaxID=2726185 RepID=A0A6H2GX39_9BACL|nr:CobW family GTP-binding protein [Paenibacillus albicereus]QJC51965.1 GTP-binding protein [Paenibacillus albicereus]